MDEEEKNVEEQQKHFEIDFSKFPYPNIRSQQKNLLNAINSSLDKYKYFILQAPTGIGKSAVAKTICGSFNNSFIITSTKQLQDQYINEFKDGTITSIKGKANYKCNQVHGGKVTCENGPCIIDKKLFNECKHTCPYFTLRKKALRSKTVLTSYQYFFRALECAQFWKPRNIIIFDEAHTLENQLVQWGELNLSIKELQDEFNLFEHTPFEEFVVLSAVPDKSGYKDNKLWIDTLYKTICIERKIRGDKIKEIYGVDIDLDNLTDDEIDELYTTHRDYYQIDKIYKKLYVFNQYQNKDDWIIKPNADGLQLTPVNIATLFHFYIKKYAIDKIFFMSATILDLAGMRKMLGLPVEKTVLMKMSSPFDPKLSPIYYKPVCKMNYQELDENLDNITKTIEEILDKHPNEKGVIHTGNYKIAKYVYANIKSNERLLIKNDDITNEKLIKQHEKSTIPTVLISPSLTTGADLKDDLSRFQIIVKNPFLSLADERVKLKSKINRNWYVCEMFKTLIQAAGRSTRSMNDYSTTYVLDKSFKWWINHYKCYGWFDEQFMKRIIWE